MGSGVVATPRKKKALEPLPDRLDAVEVGAVGWLKPKGQAHLLPTGEVLLDPFSLVKTCVIENDGYRDLPLLSLLC